MDVTPLRESGTDRPVVPALEAASYPFDVEEGVSGRLTRTLLKAIDVQRCGIAHPAASMGSAWADPKACHLQDRRCERNRWDE